MSRPSAALAALLRGEAPPLNAAAEWDKLTREARAEGVAPLAFWTLVQARTFSALPISAQNALRQAYFESWRQNQEFFQELESLAREFQRAGIPFVLLKGACFALTLYPDVGVRPMRDLDILVPAARWKGCVRFMKTLGYEEAFPEALPGLNDALAHEISLQKKNRAVLVEIHRSLLGSPAFRYAAPMDWFWEQTRPFNHPRFPGALIFSPAAQLLYASAHAMLQPHAKGVPLRWFADMDRLIRASIREADWDVLLRQAEAFKWSAALAAALQTARETFGTPIPPDVLQVLAGRAQSSPLAQTGQTPLTHTQAELQKMAALRLHGKIRLALALVFPSPAYMRRRYALASSLPLPFYYVLRWTTILSDGLRALRTGGKRIFGRIFARKLSKT